MDMQSEASRSLIDHHGTILQLVVDTVDTIVLHTHEKAAGHWGCRVPALKSVGNA